MKLLLIVVWLVVAMIVAGLAQTLGMSAQAACFLGQLVGAGMTVLLTGLHALARNADHTP